MFKEGKIKSYNVERGFGFIQQDQAQDLFFSYS
ncbi:MULTISPECIES: cold-shock protein [unclassified Acinetobacter]|nr:MULTISPECIES: cold shock domain-containing protein [unclassified Acinetobacter]